MDTDNIMDKQISGIKIAIFHLSRMTRLDIKHFKIIILKIQSIQSKKTKKIQTIIKSQRILQKNTKTHTHKQMHKNKTHRIISISPTSKNTTIKNPPNIQPNQSIQLKSSTPIKPNIAQTRTNTHTLNTNNTNRSTAFRCDDSLVGDDVKVVDIGISFDGRWRGGERDGRDGRDGEQGKGRDSRGGSFKIDEILHRIGNTYEGEKSNSSSELMKKTQISYLRQYLRQAKSLVSMSEYPISNPLKADNPESEKLEQLSKNLHQKISICFSGIHKQLYKKQKELYEQLDQKIFHLKQKNITKCYQIATLKNYIEKCESDINTNYQDIINKIDIKQVGEIVNSYTQRLDFYVQKIKERETLKLEIGQIVLDKFVDIRIVSEGGEEGLEIGITSKDINSMSISSKKSSIQKQNNTPVPRISLQKCQKLEQLLQQTQNISISNLMPGKIRQKYQDQPRIASARGKY